jgi:hypothetical protein
MKSKVTITGTKKQGFILSVEDKHSYQDLAVTFKELKEIAKLIYKLDKKEKSARIEE